MSLECVTGTAIRRSSRVLASVGAGNEYECENPLDDIVLDQDEVSDHVDREAEEALRKEEEEFEEQFKDLDENERMKHMNIYMNGTVDLNIGRRTEGTLGLTKILMMVIFAAIFIRFMMLKTKTEDKLSPKQ